MKLLVMDKSKDITGQRFGRWTVLKRAGNNSGGTALWLCRCSCGTEATVRGTELRYGRSSSCGCFRSEQISKMLKRRNTTHGLSHSKEYSVWQKMIARCHNPNDPSYERYGARGIYVCKRWRNSFSAFYSDMGRQPTGHTIDRINNSGPYSPKNCRWATSQEQANNTTKNKLLSHNGLTMTQAQWAETLGITAMTLWKRLARGVPLARALTPGTLKRGQ